MRMETLIFSPFSYPPSSGSHAWIRLTYDVAVVRALISPKEQSCGAKLKRRDGAQKRVECVLRGTVSRKEWKPHEKHRTTDWTLDSVSESNKVLSCPFEHGRLRLWSMSGKFCLLKVLSGMSNLRKLSRSLIERSALFHLTRWFVCETFHRNMKAHQKITKMLTKFDSMQNLHPIEHWKLKCAHKWLQCRHQTDF